MKSLSQFMSSRTASNHLLHKAIWKEFNPKRLNSLFGKPVTMLSILATNCRNTALHSSISTLLSHMHKETWLRWPHLLQCLFAKRFWMGTVHTFEWNITFRHEYISALTYALTGHPFNKQKKIIWMYLIQAFVWNIWKERETWLRWPHLPPMSLCWKILDGNCSYFWMECHLSTWIHRRPDTALTGHSFNKQRKIM